MLLVEPLLLLLLVLLDLRRRRRRRATTAGGRAGKKEGPNKAASFNSAIVTTPAGCTTPNKASEPGDWESSGCSRKSGEPLLCSRRPSLMCWSALAPTIDDVVWKLPRENEPTEHMPFQSFRWRRGG